MSKIVYPETKRSDHVDVYHNQSINDPYNWLEHPDNAEVVEWVNQQNKVTQQYINEADSQKVNQAIKNRLEELYDYPRFGCPYHRKNKLFFFKNSGLQNQSVLYMQSIKQSNNQAIELEDDEQVLLDPNEFSTDGTAALGSMKFSEDGSMLAYGVSRAGSDWQSIEIVDCSNKKQLVLNNQSHGESVKEKLDWVKFSSISWTHDSRGFFYSRYPTPKEFLNQSENQPNDQSNTQSVAQTEKAGSETSSLANQALYYHTIGTDQSQDKLVYQSMKHPDWMVHGEVSDCGHFLIISISESTEPVNRLYYARLIDQSYKRAETYNDESNEAKDRSEDRLVKLVDHFKHEYSYITNDQSTFYFKTNRDAPKYRIIRTDFSDQSINQTNNQSDDERWIEVLPQHETDVLNAITCVDQSKFICVYMHNAHEIVNMYTLTNQTIDQSKCQSIKLPDLGSIAGLSSRKEDNFFFYQFTSFIDPGQIVRVDLINHSINQTVFRTSSLKSFDPSQFQTEQVWYSSKDGTKVPMFVIGKRDQSNNRSKRTPKPCFLYGYGGFNISLTPSFAVSRAFFLGHFDGYYVVANIRGGGEFGEEWHKAGTKLNKQNVFDDFISAAHSLINQGYTSSKQLIINGGSNGGLLVGACVNQEPQLFGAAVAAVGVLDMLKFHKFTIGWAWKSDYGSSEDKDEFEYLLKYSPVHTVKDDRPFPALLLTTGDHDDRVVPLHSYKYISEVQHKLANKAEQTNPLLIRIETNAGHGAGMPLSKRIQEQADVFTFIAKALNLEVKL